VELVAKFGNLFRRPTPHSAWLKVYKYHLEYGLNVLHELSMVFIGRQSLLATYLEVCEHFKEEVETSLCNITLCMTESPDNGIHHKLQLLQTVI
jgi:hypothetical protein